MRGLAALYLLFNLI